MTLAAAAKWCWHSLSWSVSVRVATCAASATSQLLQHFHHSVLEQPLPGRRQQAVAVFLGAADVLELLGRRGVVDVAVRVAGHKGVLVRRCLLDVQADLDREFA